MASDEKKSTSVLSGKKILLIEDDLFLSDLVALKFSTQNCIFLHASDGEKALPMVEKEMPDIILLDILLPGINGFELLEKFKSNLKTKNIPVVILSNLNEPSDFEKGKKLQASCFLVKAATSTDEVLLKLKEILGEAKKLKT